MTEIFFDPTQSNIVVQVKSQSLHAVGFEISVFAADGNTVLEQFKGDTKTDNPFTQKLNNNPATYKDTYVSGTFTVVSPDGSDGTYSISFSILVDDVTVNRIMHISGTTTKGQDTTPGTFHLN